MPDNEQIRLSGGGLKLAIVADDLTGALDAAAPFADRGLKVRVATSGAALAEALHGAEVVAVSTRSREIAPDEARERVAAVLSALPPGVRLFKKVDSRLKGNVAAELSAFPPGQVLAVPALPEFGRIVRRGAVSGFGVAEPIAIAARLGRESIVPDVATAEDMAAVLGWHGDALVVGARGAAVALADRMAQGGRDLPAPGLPMVVVVGSTDPITLAQVGALQAGWPGLHRVSAQDGIADCGPEQGVMLVQAVPGRGASGPDIAAALAKTVAGAAVSAQSLVLTGGATAEAVLDRLGVAVLDLQGDLLPGLPLSRGGSWCIVTKSGGFGGTETLLQVVRRAGA
jgi:uncharacterized protein YgbK (DUF1537 family)